MDLPTAILLEVIALIVLLGLCDLVVRAMDAAAAWFSRLRARRAARKGAPGA